MATKRSAAKKAKGSKKLKQSNKMQAVKPLTIYVKY